MTIELVDDYLSSLPRTKFKYWGYNAEKLLLRIHSYLNDQGLGGIDYFLQPDKRLQPVIDSIEKTATKELRGSTLRQYYKQLIAFLKYWSGYNNETHEASNHPEILLWKNGKNFIGSLKDYMKKISVMVLDKSRKYNPERVDSLLTIIAQLPIPLIYKEISAFARFSLRRRSALCYSAIEHINEEDRSMYFYEKNNKQYRYEFTKQEWLRLQKWIVYRNRVEKIRRKEIIDFNPMTGENDHPLFWNRNFERIKPSSLSQYFWKLSKSKFCNNCLKRLSVYDLEQMVCEKCKTSFDKNEWVTVDFHIHLDRGAGASELLDLGVPVSDVAKHGGWDDHQTVSKHYDASDEKKARERVREIKEGISKCPSCKKRIPRESVFCPFCAYKINMSP